MKKITEAKMLAAVKKVATHYRRMSCRGRGVPDALVSYKGQTFFVEVKAPGDKASAAQINFGRQFPTIFIFADKYNGEFYASISPSAQPPLYKVVYDFIDVLFESLK